MSEYDTDQDDSDRSESDSKKNKDGPSEMKSESANRALKSAEQKLRRSTRQKNPMMQFGYNKYMAQHYAYMTRVAEVCDCQD